MNRDLRGREIQYKDGKRILHPPKKKLIDCFLIEDINFEVVEDKPIEKNIVNDWNRQYIINQQHGK